MEGTYTACHMFSDVIMYQPLKEVRQLDADKGCHGRFFRTIRGNQKSVTALMSAGNITNKSGAQRHSDAVWIYKPGGVHVLAQ